MRIPAKSITHSGGIASGHSGHRDHPARLTAGAVSTLLL